MALELIVDFVYKPTAKESGQAQGLESILSDSQFVSFQLKRHLSGAALGPGLRTSH